MKNDNVNRPNHYRKGKVECIDAIKSACENGYETIYKEILLSMFGGTGIRMA